MNHAVDRLFGDSALFRDAPVLGDDVFPFRIKALRKSFLERKEIFLGHSVSQRQTMSEETAKTIDAEVRRIVTDGYKKARELIFPNRDKLEAITQALMEWETISGEETMTVMNGGKIVRKTDDADRGPAGPAVPVTGKPRPRDEPELGGLTPQPQS